MLGINCKVYINTSSYGSPSWSEVTGIENFQMNRAWDEVEANVRGRLHGASLKTMIKYEFTGRIKVDHADTNYELFLTAMNSQTTTVDLMILDGEKDVNTRAGVRGEFHVFSLNEDQGLAAALYDDFVVKPAADASTSNNGGRLAKVVVSGGSPAFTDHWENLDA